MRTGNAGRREGGAGNACAGAEEQASTSRTQSMINGYGDVDYARLSPTNDEGVISCNKTGTDTCASTMEHTDEVPVVLVFTNRVEASRRDQLDEWMSLAPNLIERVCGPNSAKIHSFPGQEQSGITCDTTLLIFRNQSLTDRWLASEARRTWLAYADGILQNRLAFAQLQLGAGSLGGWLPPLPPQDPRSSAPPPPQWKSCIAVLLALFPTVVFVQTAVLPLVIVVLPGYQKLPHAVQLAGSLTVTVICMTYLSLPVSRTALAFFLRPAASLSRAALSFAAVACIFLLMLLVAALVMADFG